MTKNSTHISESAVTPSLPMYWNGWGAAVPLLILIIILVWLSIAGGASTQTFAVGGWLGLAIGVFFAKDKTQYADSIINGLADRTGMIMVVAWLFAGVFAYLVRAGDLVNGLLWIGTNLEISGGAFILVSFVAAAIFGAGVGTGAGTVIALIPILMPVGYALGADPVWMSVAILAGGCAGDSWSPVSDTTIVSAFTQGAEMRKVIATRTPLCLAAFAIAFIAFVILGFFAPSVSDLAQGASNVETYSAVGLLMLIPFAVVLYVSLRGGHLVTALVFGSVTAILLGFISGTIAPSDVFHIPTEGSKSTGAVQNGIQSVVGAIIFALFALAMARILIDSGLTTRLLNRWHLALTSTPRKAEAAIFGISVAVSVPISANAPAGLLAGPAFVRPIGEAAGISPERRSNLLGLALCSFFYMLPWHGVVIIWYGIVQATAADNSLPLPPIHAAFYSPYAWALVIVLVFSIITGWGRGKLTKSQPATAS